MHYQNDDYQTKAKNLFWTQDYTDKISRWIGIATDDIQTKHKLYFAL